MSSLPLDAVAQRCTLVLPSTGQFDSRAWRIASTLASRGHDVTVIARHAEGLAADERHPAGYRIIRVPVLGASLTGILSTRRSGIGERIRSTAASVTRLVGQTLEVRSQGQAALRLAPRADLVHAMGYLGIPVGLDLGRRDDAAVVYDARDIYVDAANLARLPRSLRRLFAAVERRWARRAGRVMTVNEPYAAVMEQRFGVPTPAVVMNCSYRRDRPVAPQRLIHERLGLQPTSRIVLYHGGFSRDRGIEQLIGALRSLADDTVLVLLGYGSLEAELEGRARAPGLAGRLFVLPAVAPEDLLDWVGSADVVAMPIQPSSLNHRLTTPNKLFEAMAAGVPVVASDLPGMAAIVHATACGVLCDPTDPAAIATAIRSILDAPEAERLGYRERALAAAHGPYSWEAQAEVLVAEYRRLTGRPW